MSQVRFEIVGGQERRPVERRRTVAHRPARSRTMRALFSRTNAISSSRVAGRPPLPARTVRLGSMFGIGSSFTILSHSWRVPEGNFVTGRFLAGMP